MSVFADEVVEKIKHYLERYETPRSAILPVLHTIQDHHEWIRPEHIDALHSDFGLDRVHVLEVATFYSMYRLEEPKPLRVLFCDNIVCCMMGANETMDKIRDYMKKIRESGEECPISLQGVPCLGVCDGAPAMLVNKERYLKMKPDNVEAVLDKHVTEHRSQGGK